MNFKRIIVIALAIILFSSTNSFARMFKGVTIEYIQQNDGGIHIRYDSNMGWISTKTVNAPGIEKNILAITLCAQSSGMKVDLEIIDGYITGIPLCQRCLTIQWNKRVSREYLLDWSLRSSVLNSIWTKKSSFEFTAEGRLAEGLQAGILGTMRAPHRCGEN